MIKNNLYIFLVQILSLLIVWLIIDYPLSMIMVHGDVVGTYANTVDLVITFINLLFIIFAFLWTGYRYMDNQGSIIKNLFSVFFMCFISFLMNLYLGIQNDKVDNPIPFASILISVPVHWSSFKVTSSVWVQNVLEFIPTISAFIGLQLQNYKVKNK